MSETMFLEFMLDQEVKAFIDDMKNARGFPPEAAAWEPGERWRAIIFAGMWAAADKLNMDKDDLYNQLRPVFGRHDREKALWHTMVAAWEYANPEDALVEDDVDFSQILRGDDGEHRRWI